MKLKIKIFIYTFLLFVNSTCCIYSSISETTDLTDLLLIKKEDPNEDCILMLFDIDDTLIDSPITLNSGPWINYYWQYAPQLLPKKMPVVEQLMWYVSKSIPCISVDPNASALVALNQNEAFIVPLAFTARPVYKKAFDGIQITANQLSSIGIDFSKSCSPTEFKEHPSFFSGIIYTCGKMKGDFLKQFLVNTRKFPNRIIFIDDKLDQITSVEQAMQELGIPVDCLWYRRACMNRPEFNPHLANIQLEYLIKYELILSDEAANQILSSNPSNMSPEERLKELIELYEQIH